ncbi:hypothetical protein QTG54_010947, partial [Skeletonema marinoi]
EISLQCLAKRGLFVSFGNASGAVPAFPVLRLLPQSAYMTRPKLNDYVATREELLERAKDVFTWVKEGKLSIVIDRVFELEQVRAAHEYLENGFASNLHDGRIWPRREDTSGHFLSARLNCCQPFRMEPIDEIVH